MPVVRAYRIFDYLEPDKIMERNLEVERSNVVQVLPPLLSRWKPLASIVDRNVSVGSAFSRSPRCSPIRSFGESLSFTWRRVWTPIIVSGKDFVSTILRRIVLAK